MGMNAVDIDVSKQKSTAVILRPGGEVIASPFDVPPAYYEDIYMIS